jgi:hypothetical protein
MNLKVADTLSRLAVCIKSTSPFEAATHFEKSLEIRTILLGKSHPEVARSMYRIGDFYLTNKNYVQAEDYLNRAITIWENVLPDHYFLKRAKQQLELAKSGLKEDYRQQYISQSNQFNLTESEIQEILDLWANLSHTDKASSEDFIHGLASTLDRNFSRAETSALRVVLQCKDDITFNQICLFSKVCTLFFFF